MKPATLLIVVMAMSFFLLVLGGGGYFLTREKDDDEGEECEGPDKNGKYEIDEDGDCVFKGCKDGYYQQDGICIKSRDLSSEFLSGGKSLDCVINGYIYGQCKNESGVALTGEIGKCGNGTRKKFPKVTASAIGQGKCEPIVSEKCEVPCPTMCSAPDSLWVTDENAECRAIRRGKPVVLGSESGFCGQGTKVKTLSDDAITSEMLGKKSLIDYKKSINFSSCELEKVEVCSVPCGGGLVDVGCPTSMDTWDWVYANNETVYKTKDAEKVLRREIGLSEAETEPTISRDKAIAISALDPATGLVNEDLLPKGRKIKFKAGKQHSYEYLKENNCSIVELEPAPAPRTNEDCEIDDVEGVCSVVACGVPQQKTMTPTVTKPAWGAGRCDIGNPFTASCNIPGPDCCDITYAGKWTPTTEYEGCEFKNNEWKRKYTRTGHEHCYKDNEKFVNDGSCNYDCEFNGVTLSEDAIQEAYSRAGSVGVWHVRTITAVDARQSKGGRECPNHLIGSKVSNTYNLNQLLKANFNIIDDKKIPNFQCSKNGVSGGKFSYVKGHNCRGDGFVAISCGNNKSWNENGVCE